MAAKYNRCTGTAMAANICKYIYIHTYIHIYMIRYECIYVKTYIMYRDIYKK